MPYPNEHAARIRAPEDFQQGRFVRVNNQLGQGIHTISGKLKSEKRDKKEIQSIRFAQSVFSPEDAKRWLKDNGYDPILFEESGVGDGAKKMSEKAVPMGALCFNVDEFTIKDSNGAGSKSAPVKMSIRSGQPIHHWYWGKVVHDMNGMRLNKNRVAIDFNHNNDEVIGYLNHFNIEGESIEASGALVPYKDNDRATEIIFKSKEGVPYEASINFGGGSTVIEEVAEGMTAPVNGYDLSGPAIIFREWPLRGVAVCPYGADMNTSTSAEFSADAKATVFVMSQEGDMENLYCEENTMSDKNAETVVEPVVEATVLAAETVVEPVVEVAEKPGMKFLEAFGDVGGVWFAQGLSFEEAQKKHFESVTTENIELRAKLEEANAKLQALANIGAPKSASISEAAPEGDKTFMDKVNEHIATNKCSKVEAMRVVAKAYPELYAKTRK